MKISEQGNNFYQVYPFIVPPINLIIKHKILKL